MSSNKQQEKESGKSLDSQDSNVASQLSFSEKFQYWVNVGPKFIGIGLPILYLSGFIVLNTHLNRYGINDFELISAKHLVAGSLFLFYLICYFLFGGRATILIHSWLNIESRLNDSKIWLILAFIHSLTTLVFFLCLSSATFASIAFSQSETFIFWMLLGLGFTVSYVFTFIGIDIKLPKITIVLNILIELSAIIVFFIFSETGMPILIFFSFLGLTLYLNIVFHRFESYIVNADSIIFSIIHSCVLIIATAIMFGLLFYGTVKREIGGGFPIKANICLAEPFINSFGNNLKFKAGILSTDIIFESTNYLYFESDGKTFRVPQSEVRWTIIDQPKRNTFPKILQSWRKQEIK